MGGGSGGGGNNHSDCNMFCKVKYANEELIVSTCFIGAVLMMNFKAH